MEKLHFVHRTGHAVKTGDVCSTDYAQKEFSGKFTFNTGYSPLVYQAEAPDAIEPTGAGAVSAFRYTESNATAGVSYKGHHKAVIFGFPFETIISEEQRSRLMKQVLDFFEK